MGWTCLEELVWGDKEHKWVKPGVLQTRGPGQSRPHTQLSDWPAANNHIWPHMVFEAVKTTQAVLATLA